MRRTPPLTAKRIFKINSDTQGVNYLEELENRKRVYRILLERLSDGHIDLSLPECIGDTKQEGDDESEV